MCGHAFQAETKRISGSAISPNMTYSRSVNTTPTGLIFHEGWGVRCGGMDRDLFGSERCLLKRR